MLELAANLWNALVEFLTLPEVRAFTTILAVASAAVGLWAAMKAQKVLHTHEQQILVTQRQSLNEQWQRIDAAVLSNEAVSRTVSDILGADNIEQFRRHTFFQLLVNLLAQAAVSRASGTLSEEIYNAHFVSVAYYFRNRADLFFTIAIESEYTPLFVEDCKTRFAKLKPMTRAEMGKEIRDFANLLDQPEGPSLNECTRLNWEARCPQRVKSRRARSGGLAGTHRKRTRGRRPTLGRL